MNGNPPRGSDPNGSHLGTHTPNNYPHPPTERHPAPPSDFSKNFGATQRTGGNILTLQQRVAIHDRYMVKGGK